MRETRLLIKLLFVFSLMMLNLCFAQYVLKSVVIDEGGKKITSSGYICQLSIGQQIASNVLENSNYRAILGFWHPPYDGGVGIQENDFQITSASPLIFSLSQCYPNPFNNKTVIRYSIPKETDVSLKVFNTAGRVIRILVNGMQKPGIYNVTWNVNGVSQSQLPNGVYFYRLEAGEFTATKKMVKME